VAALLKELGFSLRANHKLLCAASHSRRDARIARIAGLGEDGTIAGVPVIAWGILAVGVGVGVRQATSDDDNQPGDSGRGSGSSRGA